ncbi:MAG: hypothetical protein ACRBFS_23705 [Aureispira sp.]
MKKMNFVALVLLVVTVLGTSCTKEQTVRKEAGTANVVLYLTANTDLTNDTTYNGGTRTMRENLPEGTEVRFIIDSEDLQARPNGNYTYDDLTFVGTVDGSGKVMIELPASVDGSNVDVKFPDLWLQERKERYNTVTNQDEVITEDKLYTKGDEDFFIHEGTTVIREYNY